MQLTGGGIRLSNCIRLDFKSEYIIVFCPFIHFILWKIHATIQKVAPFSLLELSYNITFSEEPS